MELKSCTINCCDGRRSRRYHRLCEVKAKKDIWSVESLVFYYPHCNEEKRRKKNDFLISRWFRSTFASLVLTYKINDANRNLFLLHLSLSRSFSFFRSTGRGINFNKQFRSFDFLLKKFLFRPMASNNAHKFLFSRNAKGNKVFFIFRCVPLHFYFQH